MNSLKTPMLMFVALAIALCTTLVCQSYQLRQKCVRQLKKASECSL